MADFHKQLQDALVQTEQQAAEVVLRSAVEIMGDTVMATPVDTGQARSNWRLAIDKVDGTVSGDTGMKNLAEAQASVSAAISAKQVPHYVTIANNMPYIGKLEFGGYTDGGTGKTAGGFSTQAPNGMLRISLARFDEIAKRHAKQVMGRR